MADLDLSADVPLTQIPEPVEFKQVAVEVKGGTAATNGDLDLRTEMPSRQVPQPVRITALSPEERREEARGDLARGLLWLLTFAVGGVLAFVGLGRLDGTVIAQSIFPSLIALAGTALGFYFGSQSIQTASAFGNPGDPAPRQPSKES
jgi:hypothetical protein